MAMESVCNAFFVVDLLVRRPWRVVCLQVNVKEQGRLLRQNEFLVWQGKGKKCLRQVFLFEDLILFSKARRFPDRKVRHSLEDRCPAVAFHEVRFSATRAFVSEPRHLHLQAQHQDDGHRADRRDRRLAHEVRDLVPQEETGRHVHVAVRERGHQESLDGGAEQPFMEAGAAKQRYRVRLRVFMCTVPRRGLCLTRTPLLRGQKCAWRRCRAWASGTNLVWTLGLARIRSTTGLSV